MTFTVHVLTGGIAAGKTTVVKLLKEYANWNIHVLDSDEITHLLQQPGQAAHAALKRRFPSVFDSTTDIIDRQKLSNIVFEQSEKGTQERKALNGIMQPLLMRHIVTSIFKLWLSEYLSFSGKKTIVIIDAPVFLEMEKKFSRLLLRTPLNSVIVVSTKEEYRLSRLQQRGDGCSEAEAKKRIAAQIPMEEQERLADHVIRNDMSNDDLKSAVHGCVRKLVKENANDRSRWNTLMFAVVCVSACCIYAIKTVIVKLKYD